MTKFFSNGCCICKIIILLLYLNSIADLVIHNLSKIINVSYELVQTFWHACKTITCILKICWISISHMHTQQCTQYQDAFLHFAIGQNFKLS